MGEPSKRAIAARLLIAGAVVLLVVLFVVLWSAGTGSADEASFGASADTYIRENNPTLNLGTAADMDVKSTSTLQHPDTHTHQYVHADRHAHTHDHAFAHAYMAHVSQAGAK